MKAKTKKYDYGDCDVCGSRMKAALVKQDFWIRNELIVVENVPAGVCPQCGSRVVRGDIGIRIEEIIRDRKKLASAPKLSVPSIKFQPVAA